MRTITVNKIQLYQLDIENEFVIFMYQFRMCIHIYIGYYMSCHFV